MRIYALALEKGGVGKTCLAVNLAVAFSRLNLRVLVIDLDAQAHATHWLGLAATSIRPEDSVLGVLNGRVLSDCVRTTKEGVDVLPAHAALASLPVQLATAPNSGILVDGDTLIADHQVAEAPGVALACQRQPRDGVDGTWLDLPSGLADRRNQLRAERLEPRRVRQCIEGQPHIPR